MKGINYSKDVDILLLEISGGVVDHAVEAGQFIIHYSKTGKPLIVEVMGASKFLAAIETAVYGQSRDEIVRQIYAEDTLREDYEKLVKKVVERLSSEAAPLTAERTS